MGSVSSVIAKASTSPSNTDGPMESRRDCPSSRPKLVRGKVDVLLCAWGTPAALAAKNATTAIPVVVVGVADPVSVGLVASLARPGGNVTASTFLSDETLGKQLQLLKEADQRISRVAILTNPDNPVYAPLLKDIEATARAIQVEIVRLGVQGAGDVEPAFETARREKVGGLVVVRDTVLITHGAKVVELAAKYRLPAMYGMRDSSRREGSCPSSRAFPISTGAPPSSSTRSSRAPSRPSCPSIDPPSSSSSST